MRDHNTRPRTARIMTAPARMMARTYRRPNYGQVGAGTPGAFYEPPPFLARLVSTLTGDSMLRLRSSAGLALATVGVVAGCKSERPSTEAAPSATAQELDSGTVAVTATDFG